MGDVEVHELNLITSYLQLFFHDNRLSSLLHSLHKPLVDQNCIITLSTIEKHNFLLVSNQNPLRDKHAYAGVQ